MTSYVNGENYWFSLYMHTVAMTRTEKENVEEIKNKQK